jgi:beta-mannosidase
LDYQAVENDKSLFVSEFGFQGAANIDTLNSVIEKKDRSAQSEMFEYHNKQVEGNERLFRFLAGHLPVNTDWENYIYLTQLNQGLALKTCLEHWRLHWPDTAGSIIWQLNDCWPVTSWSLIDSQLLPKISYYFVKRAFAPLLSLIIKEEGNIKNVVINENSQDFDGNLKFLIIDPDSGKVLSEEMKSLNIKSSERYSGPTISESDLPANGKWIIVTTLFDKKGYICSRNVLAGKRWKYLQLPGSNIEMLQKNDNQITVQAEKPVFFVDLYHENAEFCDRGFILLPDEQIDIEVKNKYNKSWLLSEIKVFQLNDYCV